MSVPQPSIALEGHCSAINGNTLYVLSPAGLQSLPLQENATWSEEPNGQSVTGPACVTAVPNGDASQAALYVIGGTSEDDSYGGLQVYYFGNKTWETLSPLANVLQGRTNHSAAYLNDSQSILVYAGSQPNAPSYLSSQTFLLDTSPPYNIQSFVSEAPPANQPILEPWNSSAAVMVGGSPYNTEVFTFDPSSAWQPLGTNLTNVLNPASRGTLVDGSDGSKVLEVYNFNESPNTISQIVLLDANGETAPTGQTIGSGSSSRKRKRDLTLNNWPAYNSSGAPTATRTDCAVAQGPSGLAVISGGNGDMPVALFDQSSNNWVDASKFFNSAIQQPLQPSSTSGSSASPTSSSQPSSTSDNGSGGSGLTAHQRMLRTLGITLGVLCGIAAIFILVLLFLRWRRMRARNKDGYIDEKTGNRMSFADRGASFMKEAGGSVNDLLPPGKPRFDNGSHSSMAIIAGKFGSNRNTKDHRPKSSYDSTRELVENRDGAKVIGGLGAMEMMDIGEKRTPVARKPVPRAEPTPPAALPPYDTEKELAMNDERNRSSGWSKYFATSGPTGPNGLSHLPAAYVKPHTTSGVSGLSSDSSEYSSRIPSQPSRIPSSALVPPLDIDFSKTFDGQRLSRVATGSPSFAHSQEDLAKRGSTAEAAEGQKGLIVDPVNLDRRSQISGYSLSSNKRTTMGSTLSSGVNSEFYNESGNTPWTPVSTSFKDHLINSRPTSSLYTNSVIEPRVPSRGKSAGFFPGSGTSYRPATKPKMTSNAAPTSDWAAPKKHSLTPSKAADDRDSTLTVFPRGVPSAYYADRDKARGDGQKRQSSNQKSMVSDMSWLNLGLGNNQNKI